MTAVVLRDARIFWDRLALMPPAQVEFQLEKRKASATDELAMLQRLKGIQDRLGMRAQASEVGAEMAALGQLVAEIDMRLKELRKQRG